MPEYCIELASAKHIHLLPAIELAAAEQFPDRVITSELRKTTVPVETLRTAQQEKTLWVALGVNINPLGFALLTAEDDRAHLQEMNVHPNHQRQGLGRLILETVIVCASQRGHKTLTLTTFESLPWNAQFYQSVGFRKLSNNQLSTGRNQRLREECGMGLKERVAMQLDL